MIAISPSHISDVGSFRQMTHGSTGLIPVVRRTPFQGERRAGDFHLVNYISKNTILNLSEFGYSGIDL